MSLLDRLRTDYMPPTSGAHGLLREAADRIEALEADLADERMEHNLLKELLSRPEIGNFLDGIVTEAAHQKRRWG